jgi:predicted DNA-binding mobile mystery protein A
MQTSQLAKRLHVSQSNIYHLEGRESTGTITLETLSKVAEALECQLVYAFVPKKSLEDTLEAQALSYIHKKMMRTTHSMALENQKPSSRDLEIQQRLLKEEILSHSPSKIWSDE